MNETRHPRSRGDGVYGACIHRLGPTFAVLYAYTRPHCRMRECAHCARARKREMSEAKRTRSVSFRLTDEEYGAIEKTAAAAVDEPNNWCRQLAITAARGPAVWEDRASDLYGA